MARYKFIFLILFLPCLCFAQKLPDAYADSLLRKGIDNIVNQKYDLAFGSFVKFIDKYPKSPLGHLYLAAVKIARADDYGTQFDDKFITQKLDYAAKLSEKLISEDPNNKWNIYYLALSRGYAAYYASMQSDYIAAFDDGLESYNLFTKCVSIDSLFYDSYIALGSYKYWKSAKSSFLNWLPFVEDETDLGIFYLKKAGNNSSYNNYLAVYSLMWIYIDKDKPHEAVKIAESALKKYPDSRFFKWGLARAYEDIDKNKSIAILQDIMHSLTLEKNLTKLNETVIKHKMAMFYNRLGRNEESLKLCSEILNINGYTQYEKAALKERLERVKKLRAELLNK